MILLSYISDLLTKASGSRSGTLLFRVGPVIGSAWFEHPIADRHRRGRRRRVSRQLTWRLRPSRVG